METLQEYVNYQKEINAPPQLQNTSENTAVIGTVADAVKQMTESLAGEPRVSAFFRAYNDSLCSYEMEHVRSMPKGV